jgi:hypothetical protein
LARFSGCVLLINLLQRQSSILGNIMMNEFDVLNASATFDPDSIQMDFTPTLSTIKCLIASNFKRHHAWCTKNMFVSGYSIELAPKNLFGKITKEVLDQLSN